MKFARLARTALAALTLSFAVLAVAQTPTLLYSFKGGTVDVLGPQPYGTIAQGRDGNLWSATPSAAANGFGGVYSATTGGTEALKHSFVSGEGTSCQPGTNLGTDGNFYGTCYFGGANGAGSVYQITPGGTFKLLYSFTNGADSAYPNGPPIMATDGSLYGTNGTNSAAGVVYKLTTAGVLTVLHTFSAGDPAGYGPSASLLQGSDGSFYGSTQFGATGNNGTIFKITTAGVLTVLHSFAGTDGSRPDTQLVQGNDGNYYGTAYAGGTNGLGVVFKMTPAGTVTVLHNFTGGTDGASPTQALVLASDGNFYATTYSGQATTNDGIIYKVTAKGVYSVLFDFPAAGAGGAIGQNAAALFQHTNGLLYGTTQNGGTTGSGDIYSLNVGAKAFAKLNTVSGKVGSRIGIFGQGFSSSSVVKFNGVQATTVTLTGTTYLTATVPPGATDGFVTVTTGTTTLPSSKKFTVHDSWSSGAAIPTPISFPAGTGAIGTKIYVVGGATASGNIAANQVYNTATNAWNTAAALPTALAGGSAAVVNNILYIFGGYSGSTSGSAVNTVWAFNPATNAWTAKANMPTARGSIAAVVSGTVVYVIGGNGSTLRLNTMEAYDTVANSWSTKAPLITGKSDLGGALLGGKVYAADGYNAATHDNGDNEAYTIASNSWNTAAADPIPRNSMCYGAVGSVLYLSGGVDGSNIPQSSSESYNATSDKWTTLASPSVAAVAPGSAVVAGRLYCISGGSSSVIGQGTLYNNVQIYQP